MTGLELLTLAQQVCRTVRIAWRDDFTQDLVILALTHQNGYTPAQVRRWMELKLRGLYRREHKRAFIISVPLEPLPLRRESVSADYSKDLTMLYMAAKGLSPPHRSIVAVWLDECLIKRRGALTRTAARCEVSLTTAKEVMRRWREAITNTNGNGHKMVPTINTVDELERKLQRKGLGNAKSIRKSQSKIRQGNSRSTHIGGLRGPQIIDNR